MAELTSHFFTDGKGRKWDCSITVGTVRRVRTAMQLDLIGLIDEACKGLVGLLQDRVRLTEAIYWVTHKGPLDECTEADQSDFCDGFSGDVLEASARAFQAGFVDFFENPEVRKTVRALLEAGREVQGKATAKLTSRINKNLQTLDLDLLAETVIKQSGELQDTSALTPETSLTAS